MLWLYAITLLCACALLAMWWKWKPMLKNGPPVLPGVWPIVGHLPLLAGGSAHLANLAKKVALEAIDFGGIVTLYYGPNILYAISDPEDCETVSNMCLEKHYLYKFGKPWIGEGLVIASLTNWKRNRKLLNPAFGHQVLNGFIEEFNNQGRKLVEDLTMKVGRGPFDPEPYITLNSLQTICKTALGMSSDTDSTMFSEYMVALRKLCDIFYERMQKVWYHSDIIFNWSSLKKTQDEVIRALHNVSNMVLKKRKLEMEQNYKEHRDNITGKYKPFMDHILELSFEKGLFTDSEIREQTDNVIVGGHDTMAGTLTYTVILIGSHPDVQEKLYEEICEVLGNTDRDVEKDDLPKLVYLEAVIKESMRLYPIAPVIARDIDSDLKLKNYTLQAGTSCLIMTWGLHLHPSWGPDVEQFKPERWLDPATLPDNPSTFAGFSIGKRGCIGKVHAMMSMKTTLAHLLRSYCITADVTKLKVKLDIMLKPASGHDISIERRS